MGGGKVKVKGMDEYALRFDLDATDQNVSELQDRLEALEAQVNQQEEEVFNIWEALKAVGMVFSRLPSFSLGFEDSPAMEAFREFKRIAGLR